MQEEAIGAQNLSLNNSLTIIKEENHELTLTMDKSAIVRKSNSVRELSAQKRFSGESLIEKKGGDTTQQDYQRVFNISVQETNLVPTKKKGGRPKKKPV